MSFLSSCLAYPPQSEHDVFINIVLMTAAEKMDKTYKRITIFTGSDEENVYILYNLVFPTYAKVSAQNAKRKWGKTKENEKSFFPSVSPVSSKIVLYSIRFARENQCASNFPKKNCYIVIYVFVYNFFLTL